MDHHHIQKTLRHLRDFLEEGLITHADYTQQKEQAFVIFRKAVTSHQIAPKEALLALKELYTAACLTDAEYEVERKAVLHSMISNPTQTPPQSSPNNHKDRAYEASAADVWRTGGKAPPSSAPSDLRPPEHGADAWATNAEQAPASSTKDPLQGRILLGRFRIENLAGIGGMGRVYRCFDLYKKEYYALKLLPSAFAHDEHLRQQMLHEIHVNERLSHPHIARTFDFFQDTEVGSFFTMEWLEGQTFEQVILEARQRKRRPALPFRELHKVLRCIGDALEHAHQAGVVHRDLKPSNLMMLLEGQSKVMDFGIAKVIDHHTTRHTGMRGTPFYMSPEQLRGDEKVAPSADVYSLGAFVYEMLTLEVPVGHIAPASQCCPVLPKEVDEILLKALEGRVERRYATVASFLDALLPWLSNDAEEEKLDALYELVWEYLTRGTPSSLEGARAALAASLSFLQKMAKVYPRALALLGRCYLDGIGLKADPQKAYDAFYAAAVLKGHDPIAQNALGYCLKKGIAISSNPVEASRYYRLAAEQGFALAQTNLGQRLANGEGVLKNESEAVLWYRQAAKQGYPQAQFFLGFMYEQGRGIHKDEIEAAYWYRQAAKQGDPQAQFFLGLMCEQGRGVKRHLTQAVTWYRKAAKQGNLKAREALLRFDIKDIKPSLSR